MTAYIAERTTSRPSTLGRSPAFDLIYVVLGTDDDAEVRALVVATAPATAEDLVLEYINIDPSEGGNVWTATARYSLFDVNTEEEFDTGGGTQRISTSLSTITRTAAPGYTAPDYKGAVNVREDRVEGADVTIPVYNWGKSISVASSVVNSAFKLGIFNLTGKVNSLAFKGFAAGEVLFLGASGRRRGRDKWRIDYRFASSPNIVSAPVGGSTSFTVSKLGWDFLWVRFDDSLDANRIIKIPTAAYVERVYTFADLNALGI